ncbi:MAG: YcgL domain-containing protein [Candidatus Competibacterales bacterium]
MHCTVYRSEHKPDTYLYLAAAENFQVVPGPLLATLGALVAVMELTLHPNRRLAREDPKAVLRQLLRQGWYLQLPPQHHLDA